MTREELESAALSLNAQGRAHLASRLLESLEHLSDAEIERLWVEEAIRRGREWDLNPGMGRDATDVLREAEQRLRQRTT